MKQALYLFIFTLLIYSTSLAQNIGDFRSSKNGVWSAHDTWERYSGATWVAASVGQLPSVTSRVDILHTVTLDVNNAVCYNLVVDATSSLITDGDTNNQLLVYHDIENNGTMNLYDAGNYALLNFVGNENSLFSGTGSVTDIHSIVVNKNDKALVVELSPDNFTVQDLSVDAPKFLTLTRGLFRLSGNFAMSSMVFIGQGTNLRIYDDEGFWLDNENFVVIGQDFTNSEFRFDGVLGISKGIFNVGATTPNMLYAQGSLAEFTLEGGTVNATGAFYANNTVKYTQTGGILNLATMSVTTGYWYCMRLSNSSSTFVMSGGTINIINTNTADIEYYVSTLEANTNITGGVLNIGTSATSGDLNFEISGRMPNVVVNNNANVKTAIFRGTSYINGNLTVNGIAKYYNSTNIYVYVKGNVLVNSSAILQSSNLATADINHYLHIDGNLVVNGEVDGYTENGGFEGCLRAVFTGTSDATISGVGALCEFYSLEVNKGSDMTAMLDVQRGITIDEADTKTSRRITVSNGTLKFSGNQTTNIKPYYNDQEITSVTGKLWLANPNLTISWVNGYSARLRGDFILDAGTFNTGTNFYMETTSSGNNHINGGVLNVGSGFSATGNSMYVRKNLFVTGGLINVGSNFYIDGNGTDENGNLVVSGGVINIGDGDDLLQATGDGGDTGFGGDLTMSAGEINVFGRMEWADGTGTEITTFTMTGGNINIDPQHITSLTSGNDIVIFQNNTIVDFSGGKLTIVDPMADKSSNQRDAIDIRGQTGAKNFIGSTIQFGNGVSSETGDDLYPGYCIYVAGGDLRFGDIILDNPSGTNREFYGRDNTNILCNNLTILTANDKYVINGKNLDIAGDFINNGTLDGTVRNSNNHLLFTGTTSQNYSGSGSITATLNNLTFNNSSSTGVTLNNDLGATNVYLTDGNVYTSSLGSGLLTVYGTTAASLSGGGAANFVDGPLRRALSNTLSNATFNFPVGTGDYNGIEMRGVSTSGTGIGYITAEAIVGATNGTGGDGLRDPLNADNLFWKIDNTLASVSLDAVSNVQLSHTITTPPVKVIGQSNNIHNLGTYKSIGGMVSGGTITSDSYILDGINPLGSVYLVLAEVDPLKGTYYVGNPASSPQPLRTFLNLTEVANILRKKVVDDNVFFEMLSTYDDNTETTPIVFNTLTVTDPAYQVTIRPLLGVSGTATEQSVATASEPLIIVDGISNLHFDGRPGSVGSCDWIFSNTTLANAGPTFEFRNGASKNSIKYLKIKSDLKSTTQGVINYAETANLVGNSNNEISFCDISGYNSTCSNGIYSGGTAGIDNIENIISNNNIFDFFLTDGSPHGIFIDNNSSNWIITNNNFYQTSPRIFTADQISYGIQINSGQNHLIENNIIGYANNTQTGYTEISGSTGRFIGIRYAGNAGASSTIANNTISGIKLSTASTNSVNGVFTGIWVETGNPLIDANTIGSTGIFSDYPIQVDFSANNGQVIGIYVNAPEPIQITNNQIGGVRQTGNREMYFIGVQTNNGNANADFYLNNNTIGSTTQLNSVLLGDATSTNFRAIYGFWNYASSDFTATNNVIANLTGQTTSTSGNNCNTGIYSQSGVNTISNNQIYNLTHSTGTSDNYSTASLMGIGISSSQALPHTLTGNIIYGLENNNAAGNRTINISGIYVHNDNIELPINIIDGNFVHSFDINTNNSTSNLYGIFINDGNYIVTNNMVRLGIDKNGNNVTNPLGIYAMHFNGDDFANFYHNSLYVGGDGVVGTANTYAFYKRETKPSNINNNIFMNVRSNSSGTGEHVAYALSFDDAIQTDYNIYYASGTGGVLAKYDGVNMPTLRDMQVYSNYKDMHSGEGDALFGNVTGDAATVDMHLASPSPAEGMGSPLFTVSTDFEGQDRSSLTITDIGADADAYVFNADVDIYAPVFTYVPIEPQNCGITSVSIDVTITDQGMGVNNTSAKPRVWYREKGAGAWTSTEASLQSGTTNDGVWRFTLTGLVDTKFYEYYFVAQDLASVPNVGYSKFDEDAPLHSSVTTQTAPPDAGVNIDVLTVCVYPKPVYIVGNKSDCPTCSIDFETLTAYGDFFFNMNAMIIDKDVTCKIITNTTEPATFGAEELFTKPAGADFSITIEPFDASVKTLTTPNTVNKTQIRFEGADRYTINGEFEGDGNRYLNFIHQKNDQPVFKFVDDAQYNTISHLIIEGSSGLNPSGIIYIDTANVSGNNFNTISYNIVTDKAGTPLNTIYARGSYTKPAAANKNNNILGNILSDFRQYCIWITPTGNGDNWNISDNTIFNTASTDTLQAAIRIEAGGGHSINGNKIGGNAADNSGTWTNASSSEFNAIYFDGDENLKSNISNNLITNISLTNSGYVGIARGIRVNAGWADINDNIINNYTKAGQREIYLISYNGKEDVNISGNSATKITKNEQHDIYGIYINTGTSSINTIENNSFSDISLNNTNTNSDFFGIYINNGTANLNNNTFGGSNTNDVINIAGGDFLGIRINYDNKSDDLSISDNIFKNIDVSNTNVNSTFTGIEVANGNFAIKNNILGGDGINDGIYVEGGEFRGVVISGDDSKQSVSGNNISNVTLNGNAIFTGIYFYDTEDVVTMDVENNIIDNIAMSNTGANAIFYGYRFRDGKLNFNNNICGTPTKGINNNGTGDTYGIYFYYDTDAGSVITNNSIANINGKGNVTAIYSDRNVAHEISNNTINAINTSNNIVFTAIRTNSGTVSIQDNDINDIYLSNTGSNTAFRGIWASGGIANIGTVSPNIIGKNSSPIRSEGATENYGIWIYGANASTIANNSLTNITSKANVIAINNASNNVSITGNDISGWDFPASDEITFTAIKSTGTNASVQNNEIGSINLLNTGNTTQFIGIDIAGGNANVGNLNPNIIGWNGNEIRNHGKARITGIRVGGGTGSVIQSNNIYGLSGVGKISAIYNSATNTSIINHIIENWSVADETIFSVIETDGNNASIQNNTIKNINMTGTSATSIFYGIEVSDGYANVGAIAPNYIGNNGAITNNGIGNICGIAVSTNVNGSQIIGNEITNLFGKNKIIGIFVDSNSNVLISENEIGNYDLSTNNIEFTGIRFHNGNNASANNNLITSMNITNNSTFLGIHITGTLVNIGSTSGNTITNINYDGNQNFIGLYFYGGSGIANVDNNIVSNIDVASGNFLGAYIDINAAIGDINLGVVGSNIITNITNSGTGYLAGVYNMSNDNLTIANNRISNLESTNTASIVAGIYDAGTGTTVIESNTINHLSGVSTLTNAVAPIGLVAIQGIACHSSAVSTVQSNTIFEISGAGASADVAAIVENAANVTIQQNIIYNIDNSSATGSANGILLNAINSATGVSNNMLSIGGGNATNYRGIYISNENNIGTRKIYHNSVNMKSTGAGTSMAFYNALNAGGTLNVRNNIFYDQSSSPTSYTVYNSGSAWNSSASDFNIFYNPNKTDNTTDITTFYNGTAYSFDDFLTTTGGDANSVHEPVSFTDESVADLHLDGTETENCKINGRGTPIATVTTDFDTDPRHTTHPDIGADEITGDEILGYWTGKTNNIWKNSLNWGCKVAGETLSKIYIPDATTTPNDPVIITGDFAQNLTIQNKGILTVLAGEVFTVNGDLVIDGTMTLESAYDATNGAKMAMLRNFGNITNNGTGKAIQQLYLSENRWHDVSVGIRNGSYTGGWIWIPENANDQYINNAGWTWGNSLAPGVGFAIKSGNSALMSYTGKIFNYIDDPSGEYTLHVGYKATGVYNDPATTSYIGSNFIGNPFPAAVDADVFIAENTDILEQASIEIFDSRGDAVWSGEEYVVYNSFGASGGEISRATNFDGYIQPGQSFWITVKKYGTVKFNKSMICSTHDVFYKNRDNKKRVHLSIQNDKYFRSSILVGMVDGATDSIDFLYDATKNNINSNLSFYSFCNDKKLAIQGLNKLKPQQTKIVNLSYTTSYSGFHAINAAKIENFEDYETVFLEDLYDGKIVNLKQTSNYEFKSEAGIIDNRFRLIFNSLQTADQDTTETNNEIENNNNHEDSNDDVTTIPSSINYDNKNCTIYSFNQNVYVIFNTPVKNASISIFDSTGKLIKKQNVNASSTKISLAQTGIYIVKVKTTNYQTINKVYINK